MDHYIENIKKIVSREFHRMDTPNYSVYELIRMEAFAQGIKLTEKQIHDMAKRIIFEG